VAAQHDVFHGVHVVEQLDVLKGAGNAGPGHFIRLFTADVFTLNDMLPELGCRCR
jgi:hypothetical protein